VPITLYPVDRFLKYEGYIVVVVFFLIMIIRKNQNSEKKNRRVNFNKKSQLKRGQEKE